MTFEEYGFRITDFRRTVQWKLIKSVNIGGYPSIYMILGSSESNRHYSIDVDLPFDIEKKISRADRSLIEETFSIASENGWFIPFNLR